MKFKDINSGDVFLSDGVMWDGRERTLLVLKNDHQEMVCLLTNNSNGRSRVVVWNVGSSLETHIVGWNIV